MTEFIRVLRHGSWSEKRKVLKYTGLASYDRYGPLKFPGKDSRVVKKNQIIINEFWQIMPRALYQRSLLEPQKRINYIHYSKSKN